MEWNQEGTPGPTISEKRGGLMADDKAKGEFCEKVDHFGGLYGLKTMDYYGCTRGIPYKPSATNNEESGI